jgi:heterodisulfide reductase subunit C
MVLATTGQDVRRCSHCELCTEMTEPDQDLSLESVIQLIVINDEEVLTSRTVWSDAALASARHVCTSNLDMEVVLLALRDEARRRGLTGPATDHHRSNELESGEFQESSL